jgi:hypothetical protein
MTISIHRRIAAVAILAVVTTVPRAAFAQAPTDSTPSPTIALRVVQPGDSLRRPLRATTGTRRVWEVPAGGGAPKRNTVRGAVIGGVTGAVVGALAGGVIGGGFCDAADCSDVTRDGILAGGALGAVAGAGIGALIGYIW